MGYEVIRINENSWRIEDTGVRFFLLTGKERALLIDSGMLVRNAREIAASLTDLPLELLNTHADMDHVGSNSEFATFYMHPAEEPNYRIMGRRGTIIPVDEGDIIDLGERELKIIHLPGHTPGSIAVLDIRNRVLISGDPIQENGRIFMFGEQRNMDNYIRSLSHLETYMGEFDEIWPSHGNFPISPELIPKLREGAERVLAGEIRGIPTDILATHVWEYDLGFASLLCDE